MNDKYLEDNLKLELYGVIKNIANFLFISQVSFDDSIILNNLENTEKIVVCLPFNNSIKVNWNFKYFDGVWHFQDSKKQWQLLPINGLVRLPVYGYSYHQDVQHQFIERKTIISKIRHYFLYDDFLIRSIKHVIYKFINLLIGKIKSSHDCKNKNLSKDGGVTFAINVVGSNVLKLNCVDTGGIYDKELDDETTTWPDQVPVGHYSTEFAAYVFYWMWKNTSENKWLEACQRALVFFNNNFKPYTCVTFNSYEFKVLPIACLIKNIINNGEEQLFSLQKIKEGLCDSWLDYDPVNIHALRIANFAILKSIGLDYDYLKLKLSSSIVKNNQTNQGLIADNRGGSLCHSADLTYHQFSLGCLALAYQFNPDPVVKNIVEKAINFSRYISTADGHVSYYGRGANNVYHLAAYIFAESQLESPNYDKIFKIIKKISYFSDPIKGLPSALNNQREKRMGWNHCEVPYNGQVGFFLCKAYETLFVSENTSNLMPVKEYDDLNGKLDFAVLANNIFKITIGRGSDMHEWSGGAHMVGMGGVCSLAINDNENYLSVNEYSAVDNLWTGDLPVGEQGIVVGNYFVGKLNKINDVEAHLSLKNVNIIYKLEKNILNAKYFLKDDSIDYQSYSGLSFNKLLVKSYQIEENKCKIFFINGDMLELVIDDNKNFIITSSVVASNPLGEAIRFELKQKHRLTVIKSFSWSLSYVGK